MTVVTRETILRTLPIQSTKAAFDAWRTWAKRRLTGVFEAAKEIPFDDDSKLVFFSDCHRGDNSRADAFAANEKLFLSTLNHYFEQGFSYIEVGDGDEMWKTRRFSDILRAHSRTFDLLHKFRQHNRLHVIFGNHDVYGWGHDQVDKDGITAEEGLIFRHSHTDQQIFVVHGHQADFKSDGFSFVSRRAVRHVWRRLQNLGLSALVQRLNLVEKRMQARMQDIFHGGTSIEQAIRAWIESHRQMIICGHTHRPMFARSAASPYFNTGSCVVPGILTGIEIQHGEIALVQWTWNQARPTSPSQIERKLLSFPKRLQMFRP